MRPHFRFLNCSGPGADGRSATDDFHVAAAQADIVKLTVGELVQRIAGDARIVPGLECGNRVRQGVDGTVGGDGAEALVGR